MRDIDVISFVSCSGTLIYIINFQFQPNLRWSNFRPQYCDIESLKWPAGSEFSCQSAPNGLIFFLSSFLRAATTGIFVSKTFSKIDILYYICQKVMICHQLVDLMSGAISDYFLKAQQFFQKFSKKIFSIFQNVCP